LGAAPWPLALLSGAQSELEDLLGPMTAQAELGPRSAPLWGLGLLGALAQRREAWGEGLEFRLGKKMGAGWG